MYGSIELLTVVDPRMTVWVTLTPPLISTASIASGSCVWMFKQATTVHINVQKSARLGIFGSGNSLRKVKIVSGVEGGGRLENCIRTLERGGL